MELLRRLELVVDLRQVAIAPVVAAEPPRAVGADLGEALRVDGQADDLLGIDAEQRGGGSIPFTTGTFAAR